MFSAYPDSRPAANYNFCQFRVCQKYESLSELEERYGMKRVLFWFLLLALALPTAALANSIDFTNSGGTLKGGSAGLSLGGSTLIVAGGPSILLTGNLGTVSFTTGALSSGSLEMGGTFAAGGTFVITGNGTGGIPNGVIFNGTFSGPVTWSLITLANGTHNYTLTGALTGTWFTGASVVGATVQLTVNTGSGFFKGSAPISSGNTEITGNGLALIVVPEPASITLFGTGLLSLASILRRKLKR